MRRLVEASAAHGIRTGSVAEGDEPCTGGTSRTKRSAEREEPIGQGRRRTASSASTRRKVPLVGGEIPIPSRRFSIESGGGIDSTRVCQ